MNKVQLEKYFKQIGMEKPSAPTFDALTDLMWAHLSHIPFDALEPVYYKRIPSLNIDDLCEKFFEKGRGGYCFEQNTVFLSVLRALGYDVYPVAARVVWHLNPGDPLPPISHMGLVVTLEGKELYCDVGYGGPCSKAPLELAVGDHEVRGELFRVENETAENGNTVVWIKRPWPESPDGYKATLRFENVPEPQENFMTYNANVAGNPMSPFSRVWVVSIFTEDGSKSLMDNVLTIKTSEGETVTELADEDAKHEAIEREFGIKLDR